MTSVFPLLYGWLLRGPFHRIPEYKLKHRSVKMFRTFNKGMRDLPPVGFGLLERWREKQVNLTRPANVDRSRPEELACA
jgi:hypothetical protein